MPVREIVVSSLGELIDRVTPEQPDPVTGRRRDSGVYRGMADPARPLLTSLDRLGGIEPPHSKRELEEHILRNFIRYSRPHFPTPPSEWELLVAAQHHGLPTRLLDWTYSPLVAAHFATVSPQEAVDRVVWRLDWQAVHRKFGLPELAMLIQDLDAVFAPGGRFTPWELFEKGDDIRPLLCMFEPPSLDSRIVGQAAVFTLCTDTRCSLDAFLARHDLEDALTRFIVPGAEVARVRDQLDLAGIDERRLFPDLDGVTSQMRRYYS